MKSIASTAFVAIILSIAFALAIHGASALDSQWADESSNVIGARARAHPRSLCNTFGGCAAARSIKSGGALVSASKSPLRSAGGAPYAHHFAGQLSNSRVKFTARSAGADGLAGKVVVPATSSPLHAARTQQERFSYDQQQPSDVVMHSTRVDKLVEDPIKLETIGRGLRLRISQ